MKTILKNKKHIRWLLPFLVILVFMAILLTSYYKGVQHDQLIAKENEIALAMENELFGVETSVSNASTALSVSGKAMSLYSIDFEKNEILTILRGIFSTTDVDDVIIINAKGDGYNYSGNEVSVGGEEYFKEIEKEFSVGSSGMIVTGDFSVKDKNEVTLVSGFNFSNKQKGYILATIHPTGFSEQLFRDVYTAETAVIATINGDILYLNAHKAAEIDENVKSLWDLMPPGLTKDMIKLNISQKNIYCSEVEGYGYVIQVPFKNLKCAGIALITYEQMEIMLHDYNARFYYLMVGMMIVSILFIILVPVVYVTADKFEKSVKERKRKEVERDALTGLLVRTSAVREINDYLTEEDDRKGLAFMIGLNLPDESAKENGKTINDERIRDFAHNLTSEFRSSDIIGRISYDRFVVFLKGVHDQKDVRKQSDHMQIFLHDSRVIEGERILTANAGAALCPENGKDFLEIIAASQEALERSKEEGPGKLSFK